MAAGGRLQRRAWWYEARSVEMEERRGGEREGEREGGGKSVFVG
jgi:hypothetical protein